MNVLSLFDGMSCGQQALERIGIDVENYFASEIDKHSIAVTMHNYPNTIQLGSVIDVNACDLPKIDLLIGGSPCQSFSFAGKRKGMSTKDDIEILTFDHYIQLKNEGYEFEGQSYLFWEYMRILNEIRAINPEVKFLLENVVMGEKWERILSRAIGITPIKINSSLVSAQNRNRLYWTNIGMKPMKFFDTMISTIKQPKDRGILLKDILETEVDERYFLSNQRISTMLESKRSVPNIDASTLKANTLIAGYNKIPTDGQYIVHNPMPRSSTTGKGGTGPLSRTDGKTYCLDTGNTNAIEIRCVAMRGRNPENPKSRESGLNTEQMIEPRFDGKTNCLTSVQKDNLVMQLNPAIQRGSDQPFEHNRIFDINGIAPTLCTDSLSPAILLGNKKSNSVKIGDGYNQDNLANYVDGKSNCLDTIKGGQKIISADHSVIRRLTPLECERLQTVKDNYTSIASDSQRYKMLGNGWTVDVIAHIFSYL